MVDLIRHVFQHVGQKPWKRRTGERIKQHYPLGAGWTRRNATITHNSNLSLGRTGVGGSLRLGSSRRSGSNLYNSCSSCSRKCEPFIISPVHFFLLEISISATNWTIAQGIEPIRSLRLSWSVDRFDVHQWLAAPMTVCSLADHRSSPPSSPRIKITTLINFLNQLYNQLLDLLIISSMCHYESHL